ncbi:hypothetical protein Mapa_011589 [Marchantia paleacea]|nr:hypothetical protein Mapa_011589 [Marchantia paleacea]
MPVGFMLNGIYGSTSGRVEVFLHTRDIQGISKRHPFTYLVILRLCVHIALIYW